MLNYLIKKISKSKKIKKRRCEKLFSSGVF